MSLLVTVLEDLLRFSSIWKTMKHGVGQIMTRFRFDPLSDCQCDSAGESEGNDAHGCRGCYTQLAAASRGVGAECVGQPTDQNHDVTLSRSHLLNTNKPPPPTIYDLRFGLFPITWASARLRDAYGACRSSGSSRVACAGTVTAPPRAASEPLRFVGDPQKGLFAPRKFVLATCGSTPRPADMALEFSESNVEC